METCYTDEQNYSTDLVGVRAIEPALNEGVATLGLAIAAGRRTAYTVTVTQSKTGRSSRSPRPATARVTRTCDTDGTKGCPTPVSGSRLSI